jgi:hypothetical protein
MNKMLLKLVIMEAQNPELRGSTNFETTVHGFVSENS